MKIPEIHVQPFQPFPSGRAVASLARATRIPREIPEQKFPLASPPAAVGADERLALPVPASWSGHTYQHA